MTNPRLIPLIPIAQEHLNEAYWDILNMLNDIADVVETTSDTNKKKKTKAFAELFTMVSAIPGWLEINSIRRKSTAHPWRPKQNLEKSQ